MTNKLLTKFKQVCCKKTTTTIYINKI